MKTPIVRRRFRISVDVETAINAASDDTAERAQFHLAFVQRLFAHRKILDQLLRGSAVDALAVCDPELRVRGVVGLRIVDASVLPAIPHGPPLAAIVAVAERAEDIITGKTPLPPIHHAGGG
jgi:hypothetical protein